VPGFLGLVICLHWLAFYGKGHVQRLQLGVTLILIAFMLMVLGILADLISANRKLIQEALFNTRSQMYRKDKTKKDS
jgi:hypothetical protein